jgi:hypothetical protein
MRKFLLFVIVVLLGCFSEKALNKKVWENVPSSNFSSNKLRLDGIYIDSHQLNSKCKIGTYLALYNNQLLMLNLLCGADSTMVADHLKEYGNVGGGYEWGTFNLSGDTIKAKLLILINRSNAQIYERRLCSYVGVLKGFDTILNWHMEEPITNYDKKFNPGVEGFCKLNKTLIFKKFPAKLMVDSNKVWLNKYRNYNK